jgi:hypothetical protein
MINWLKKKVDSLKADETMLEKQVKIDVPKNMESEADFLLKEYEHLVEYQKVTVEGYDRWFSIYLTLGAAVITVIIPLVQSFSSGNKPAILDLILGGLVAFGILNFMGLSYSNAVSIHYERAIRLIQDHFITQYPDLINSLYFRKTSLGIEGTKFQSLIIRGLSTGSQKSTVVVINSILIPLLLIKVGVEQGIILFDIQYQLIMGLAIFIISGILHVLIGLLIYKVHGVYRN